MDTGLLSCRAFGGAKAEVPVPVARVVPVAVRRAAVLGPVVPAPTAVDAVRRALLPRARQSHHIISGQVLKVLTSNPRVRALARCATRLVTDAASSRSEIRPAR